MAFQAIPGFDLDDALTPCFLEALKLWLNRGKFLFRTTAEDVQVEDTNNTTVTYSADNTQVHVTCVYRIIVPGTYVVAAGELLGPDKHGYHGFDQDRLQIHTIFGKAGDLVPLSFTLDIFKFWCSSAFPSEADVPTLRIPGPVAGVSPRVDALQIINPYLKAISSLLVEYCERQPSLIEETQLAPLASAKNIRTVVNAGLLSFVLRNVAVAIHADDEFSQREREYVFPLAKAVASKFGTAFGLGNYANLTHDGVEAFVQDFWQSSHEYCLAEEESVVWAGVAELVGKIAQSEPCGNDPRPAILLYDMFCAAFWGILSADGATEDEVAVFKRQRALIFGVFSELSFILSRPMSIRGFEAHWKASDAGATAEQGATGGRRSTSRFHSIRELMTHYSEVFHESTEGSEADALELEESSLDLDAILEDNPGSTTQSQRPPVETSRSRDAASTPNTESIAERVITIVAKQLGKSSSEVTTNHTYRDLGVDELDRVEIVMELEEEFEVSLPSEEADAVQSTAALVQLVQRHLA
jgi:acyl carrier protein